MLSILRSPSKTMAALARSAATARGRAETALAIVRSPPPSAPTAAAGEADRGQRARDHLRAACRALAEDGRSQAEVFRELRLMVNQLESGGLRVADAPIAAMESATPVPRESQLARTVSRSRALLQRAIAELQARQVRPR